MSTRSKRGRLSRGDGKRPDPSDPRLAPGAVVVVGTNTGARRACAARIREVLGTETVPVASFDLLKRYVHPGRTRPGGRPPIRGFVIEWSLAQHRDLDVLELLAWLGDVYPVTPIVLYTEERSLAVVQRDCDARGIEVVWPAGSPEDWAPPADAVRASLLGAIILADEEIPLFSREGLCTPELLRYVDEEIMAPWAANRVRARAWLLAGALPGEKVPESLLRTVEAYLETVPRAELALSRGVGRATITTLLRKVKSTWGVRLPALAQRCRRGLSKRGVARARALPWHRPD